MNKFCALLAGAAAVWGTQAGAAACSGPACGGTLLLVGTHGSGPGQGIVAVRLDPATGALAPLGLAAEVARPTWLVRDPRKPRLYAVSETGNDGKSQAGVYSFTIDRGTGRLTETSHTESGGGGATYLSFDPRSRTLFVANYGGGQVTAIPVGADGRPGPVEATAQDEGSGPHKRQAGPHAHAAVLDPGGRYLLVPDFGADRVFVYRWDATKRTLAPAAVPAQAFPAGSGPRHLVFSPDGRFAFVDTELTGEVHVFRWEAGTGRLDPVMHVALDAPDYAGTRSAAELATAPDGRFLYVSNRSANLIQVFAVDPATGSLSEVQRIDCGGQVPWSFGIDPSGRWLVVTNEASSNLAVFAVDRATGRLSATGNRLDVPKPVAVAFAR